MINRISPLFLGLDYERKLWPDFELDNIKINLKKFFYDFSPLKAFSLDFFLIDHFSRASLTINLNKYKSPPYFDFNFLNNDFF